LLKAIAGVLRVTAGRVSIKGHDVTNAAPEVMARAGVGYVPQDDDVFAPLTEPITVFPPASEKCSRWVGFSCSGQIYSF
jgi:ABC-type lipopolysaccharide export system ATPase subunit